MKWTITAMSDGLMLYLTQTPGLRHDRAVISELINAIKGAKQMYKAAALNDPVAAFQEIVQNVDFYIDRVPEQEKAELSCKKGCNFCCHINVDIYPPEAKIILDYCKNNEILIDFNYLEQQLQLPKNEHALSTTHSACVFLKQGICSIYKVRPLACRKFFVYTPAEQCDAKKYPPPHMVGVYFNSGIEILASAIMDEKDGCDRMPQVLLSNAM